MLKWVVAFSLLLACQLAFAVTDPTLCTHLSQTRGLCIPKETESQPLGLELLQPLSTGQTHVQDLNLVANLLISPQASPFTVEDTLIVVRSLLDDYRYSTQISRQIEVKLESKLEYSDKTRKVANYLDEHFEVGDLEWELSHLYMAMWFALELPYPELRSLALPSVMHRFQRFLNDLSGAVTSRSDEALSVALLSTPSLKHETHESFIQLVYGFAPLLVQQEHLASADENQFRTENRLENTQRRVWVERRFWLLLGVAGTGLLPSWGDQLHSLYPVLYWAAAASPLVLSIIDRVRLNGIIEAQQKEKRDEPKWQYVVEGKVIPTCREIFEEPQ